MLPHTDCSSRAQAHTRPTLGEKPPLATHSRSSVAGKKSMRWLSDQDVSMSVVHRSSPIRITAVAVIFLTCCCEFLNDNLT